MTVLEQLKTLSQKDALIAMETLWRQLADKNPASPEWHGEELARRDELVREGKASYNDWPEAKQRLLDCLN